MNSLKLLKATSQTLASTHPDLTLLVLFGSRARGEEDPTSDWDFAFLSDPDYLVERKPFWFPGSDLVHTLSKLLHISDDKIDLVNLNNCSEILAHFVARDGQVIYEKTDGEFAQFQQRALKSKTELREFRRSKREQVLQALQRWGI
ncbi:MAG: nucleotidyltransferase domain-containing protein [Cyanobacteria bacterium CRU_2_1]|nr:nucleotidyltransferase domain-containing protein [Cyanobacteria bacterium CRU_2_1]